MAPGLGVAGDDHLHMAGGGGLAQHGDGPVGGAGVLVCLFSFFSYSIIHALCQHLVLLGLSGMEFSGYLVRSSTRHEQTTGQRPRQSN